MKAEELEERIKKEKFYDKLIRLAAPTTIIAGGSLGIYAFTQIEGSEAMNFFWKYSAPIMFLGPLMVWARILTKHLNKLSPWQKRCLFETEDGETYATYHIGKETKNDKPAYSVHFNTTGNNSLFEVNYTNEKGEERYDRYTPDEFLNFLEERGLPRLPNDVFRKFKKLFEERHETGLCLENNCC